MSDPTWDPTQSNRQTPPPPPSAPPVQGYSSPAGGQHGGYPGPGGYGTGGHPGPGGYDTSAMDAEKAAQLSLIFGIVGLFFFGILMGPLAIWQASKAERGGKSATAGKVLGWISLLWGIGQIVLAVVVFSALLATV